MIIAEIIILILFTVIYHGLGFWEDLSILKQDIPVFYTEHNMQETISYNHKNINQFTFNSQSLALGVSEDVTNSIKKY